MGEGPARRRFSPDAFLEWFPVLLRYGALAGVFHQAVFAKFDRPYLLALYGAAMGLSELAQAVRANGTKR